MNPADYDAWYDTDRGRWIGETEYRLLSRLLAPQPGEQVLDVGCGTGWFTRRIARLPGLHVTGVDLDANGLAFAQRRDPKSTYVQADACRLPFADNSFERVMSVAALSFVSDWPHAFSEIVRVVQNRFVVGLLNRHSLLWRQKGRGADQGAYQGAHWHTRQEILRVVADLAVVNVKVSTAVLCPSGSPWARLAEPSGWPCFPFGSFLVVSGDKLTVSRGV